MPKFRFQDLEIWKKAMEIADRLYDIADELERRKLFRFADQLRGSGLRFTFKKTYYAVRISKL